jgi:hypothetical protein
MIELKSFLPFRDAAHALENANDISEGQPEFIPTWIVFYERRRENWLPDVLNSTQVWCRNIYSPY